MFKCLNVKMIKAFTLIELMVAVLVFSIIAAAASGILISSLKSQKRILAEQRILGQTSYILEYMSRTLRMAKKDLIGDCINVKMNYEKTRAGNGLQFINYKDECWEFFLDNNELKERRKIGTVDEEILSLTSSNLKVNSLNFNLIGRPVDDNSQPRVTFSLSVRGVDFGVSQPDIKIQTTISQRNLDVP
ncbi:MAG: type II secretion system protein, partial [bacterium]|nr:type II secretion system protein [bacterium]